MGGSPEVNEPDSAANALTRSQRPREPEPEIEIVAAGRRVNTRFQRIAIYCESEPLFLDLRRPALQRIVTRFYNLPNLISAFETGEKFAAEHLGAHTRASGLRVPKAIGDFIMLDAIRKSDGGAIAVPDADMITATKEVGSAEGVFTAPEGGACYAALKTLLAANQVKPDDTIVLFNTSTGLKYLECYGG